MIAAGRAAKGLETMPPQLWKLRNASPPAWSEFDTLSYREVAIAIALENVYTVVKMWKQGQAQRNPEIMKYYSSLVGAGIVGKDI